MTISQFSSWNVFIVFELDEKYTTSNLKAECGVFFVSQFCPAGAAASQVLPGGLGGFAGGQGEAVGQ